MGTSPTPECTPARASLLCLSSSQSSAPHHRLPAPPEHTDTPRAMFDPPPTLGPLLCARFPLQHCSGGISQPREHSGCRAALEGGRDSCPLPPHSSSPAVTGAPRVVLGAVTPMLEQTAAAALPPRRSPNGKPKTRRCAEPLPRATDRNILDFTKV